MVIHRLQWGLFKKYVRSFLANSDPLPPLVRFLYRENVNFYSGCSFWSDPLPPPPRECHL